MRLLRRHCPDEVLVGLLGLAPLARSRAARSYWQGMLCYAQFGRDRRKLTMGFVEQTQEKIEGFNASDLRDLP